jgi:hypothetical protein
MSAITLYSSGIASSRTCNQRETIGERSWTLTTLRVLLRHHVSEHLRSYPLRSRAPASFERLAAVLPTGTAGGHDDLGSAPGKVGQRRCVPDV